MTRRPLLALTLSLGLAGFARDGRADDRSFPPPKTLGPVESYGRNIQRTMTLLSTSTPRHRNTVKVLFYGQSITEQDWSRQVADDLRKRFPNANLVVENRAIGGFASQLLVKTAETDLYPFYPDLVIFHVYGSHIEYENILRRTRERTTAEILQQTDHVTRDESLTEETDPAKLTPRQWDPWMNHAFLPSMSKKYGTELADVHELWKTYLRDTRLPASKLLKDGVHLNAHGDYLMARLVSAHLRYDPKFPDTPWKDLVRTYEVGKDARWSGGKLTLEFDGNRVDAVCGEGAAPPAAVRIDGKKPSETQGLYARTRTTSFPRSNWPCLLVVGADRPLQAEEWTLTLSGVSADLKGFRFRLEGSKTGPDGEGSAGERFVSRSGRVVIDPADWNFDYARKVFKDSTVGDGFRITWKDYLIGTDAFASPGVKDPAVETTVTLAQGLGNGRHTLEIAGDARTPVKAIRVYRPTPR